ncbi:MAG TPA: 50S ribosomal protein L2 [Candidatus Nanoarchaeia archaeon]|nr:50S ribosomal protein L2 [Candidatus Nanoarchaeia archaeon]
MGKRLIQQRRGRGTLTYRTPKFRFQGKVKHHHLETSGKVIDLVHCAAHTAPLMKVAYLSGEEVLNFAPEGIKIGDEITVGGSIVKDGNVLPLREIPEGTLIHNIELSPGDGGKLVRSSGTFGKIVAKTDQIIRVALPSKKERAFLPECRAAIGTVAGAGRLEKPFLKAGTRSKKMQARNKLYPSVSGVAMNAVDHPFGGSSSNSKGRPTQAPRSAPPGRKVGMIAPRRTGRKR